MIKLDSIINVLSSNKPNSVKIIGSYSRPELKHSVDIDLECRQTDNSINILNNIKNIFIIFKQSKNVYITDFKCGLQKNNKALKWKFTDIINEYVVKNKQKYSLLNSIRQKSIIKIDLIVVNKYQLQEITCNYYYILSDMNFFSTVPLDSSSIIYNAIEYFEKNNTLKGLKRLYIYFLRVYDTENANEVLEILNSDIGKQYKDLNILNLLRLMLKSQFHNVPMMLIDYNLEYLSNNLPKEFKKDVNQLKYMSKKDLQKNLNITYNRLMNRLNSQIIL
jgi:hypothetical protein